MVLLIFWFVKVWETRYSETHRRAGITNTEAGRTLLVLKRRRTRGAFFRSEI